MEEQITCSMPGLQPAAPGRKKSPFMAGLLCAMFLLIAVPFAGAYAGTDRTDPYSPENILSFTCYLVEKGEYFRAWAELRRLESYYPGYISREKFDVTALYIMYKAGRYAEISDYASANQTGCAAGVIITDSLLMTGDYRAGLSLIGANTPLCQDDIFSGIYTRRRAYVSIVTGDVYSDEHGTLKPELSAYRELVEYTGRLHDSEKSPALAALLGILPGCGYIYAGDSGTGFVAMTVITLFGAVTCGSYINGIEPLAIISGAVTLFFYGGNIAGGYLEAGKYNTAIDNAIEKKAGNVLEINEDVEKIYIRFGISSDGK
ncbi:MAG TPA: hypothetical protein PK986_10440 [Spirochaetota bacterium]|nr:hypothetical protein [Spirochaetota bacterium]